MSAVPGRSKISLCCLGLCVCLVASGCAVAGKSMSIDSTSRMPWFGLELKERSRKSQGPSFRSIANDSESSVRIESLGLSKSPMTAVVRTEPEPRALPTTSADQGESPGKSEVIDFR